MQKGVETVIKLVQNLGSSKHKLPVGSSWIGARGGGLGNDSRSKEVTPLREESNQDVPMPHRVNPYVEASINDFLDKKEIGRGTHAIIYVATCKTTKKKVAIKANLKRALRGLDLHRVKREIDLVKSLNHKNIVAWLGDFEDADCIYLVQEWAPRGDLFEELRNCGGSMPECRIVKEILVPLMNALEHMHAKGVLHRDLKPENILVAADGSIKVCDFGLAINMLHERPISRLGTLQYMAPEVVSRPYIRPQDESKAETYDDKVDIWACGVLVYELIRGFPPFEVEGDTVGTTKLIINKEIKSLPDCMSPYCQDFIRLVLSKRAQERPTLAEMFSHPFLLTNARPEQLRRTRQPASITFAPAPSGKHAKQLAARYDPRKVVPIDYDLPEVQPPAPANPAKLTKSTESTNSAESSITESIKATPSFTAPACVLSTSRTPGALEVASHVGTDVANPAIGAASKVNLPEESQRLEFGESNGSKKGQKHVSFDIPLPPRTHVPAAEAPTDSPPAKMAFVPASSELPGAAVATSPALDKLQKNTKASPVAVPPTQLGWPLSKGEVGGYHCEVTAADGSPGKLATMGHVSLALGSDSSGASLEMGADSATRPWRALDSGSDYFIYLKDSTAATVHLTEDVTVEDQWAMQDQQATHEAKEEKAGGAGLNPSEPKQQLFPASQQLLVSSDLPTVSASREGKQVPGRAASFSIGSIRLRGLKMSTASMAASSTTSLPGSPRSPPSTHTSIAVNLPESSSELPKKADGMRYGGILADEREAGASLFLSSIWTKGILGFSRSAPGSPKLSPFNSPRSPTSNLTSFPSVLSMASERGSTGISSEGSISRQDSGESLGESSLRDGAKVGGTTFVQGTQGNRQSGKAPAGDASSQADKQWAPWLQGLFHHA